MKARLNITIDEEIISKIKAYATSEETSVSEIVETYFRKLTMPTVESNIISLIDQLDKPEIPENIDLKEAYYQSTKMKSSD